MHKKILIGITMSLIFVFTAFSPAISNNTNINYVPEINDINNINTNNIPVFDIRPSGKEYNFNNNGVIFSGNDPYLKLNNHYFPSQWIISNNNKMKLNIIDNKKIVNKFQNSAVEILKNKYIKVAYIYSFYNNSIHADIAIKNLKNKTYNYTLQFNLILPSNNIMENNHNINNDFNNVYLNNKFINLINIRNPYNSLSFNNVMISTSASFPLHTTIIKDNSYAVLNMVYNIVLTKNETYTIDPVIGTYGGSNVNTYGNITSGLSTGACLFNSNGKEVGIITETAQIGSTLLVDGVDYNYMVIDSRFSSTSSSYNVNCIKQELIDKNGSNGNFVVSHYESFIKDHEHNFIQKIKKVIDTDFSFLDIILPGSSIINTQSLLPSENYVSGSNINDGYKIMANAGVSDYGTIFPSITLGYWTYLWGLIPEYHTYRVQKFNNCIIFNFNSNYGTQNNPYVDHMVYTSTFTIINSYEKPVEFENHKYKAQISETFDLEQFSRT